MKLTHKILGLIGLISLLAASAPAQLPTGTPVVTGTPPFGSFGGGPFDTVDLANLNVHFDIPVLRKAGRGLPFTYDLGYDTSVWYPVTTNGTTSWQPVPNWGWIAQTEGATGVLDFASAYVCIQGFGCYSYAALFTYIDAFGAPHPIPLIYEDGAYQCNSQAMTIPGTCVASDGSGYALYISSTADYIIQPSQSPQCAANTRQHCSAPRTNFIVPPQNTNIGTAGETDSNGNQITVNSSGQFFDTLSSSTPALTVSGTAPNPTTLSYIPPSGGNPVPYTMKYASYTVKTNFGCGTTDYGPTVQNLVSEIDLPDGSKYTFSYEQTPGFPSDSTGRLTKVTMPTGGAINYSYTGGDDNTGIICADGTAATLTRTTPDGQWQYAHTENGAAWETVITPPAYNGQTDQTTMQFQGIFPTESQTTQNGSTLETVYTCYNGAAKPCNSTAITPPIAQTTTYVDLPGAGGTLESQTNTYYDTETCPSGSGVCSNGLVTQNYEYDYATSGAGPLLRKTLINYQTFTTDLGTSELSFMKPSQTSIYNGSGGLLSQTTIQYDQGTPASSDITTQHVSVSGSRGNPTTITQMASGSSNLTKTFTYFDTGMVEVATDVNGAQTAYTYGACNGAFPTSVAGPLLPAISITWNCTGGVETSLTDENGQTVSTSYTDPDFWRPASTTNQLSNVTNISYSGQTSVEAAMNFNGGNSTADILASTDGQGRPYLRQVKESPSSPTYDSVAVAYDSLGRSDQVTLPYTAAAGAACSGSCPGTTTLYDALSRPVSVTDAGGGYLDYTYTGNDVYFTAGPAPSGENTKRKQLEYDALGRLTSVCEISSTSGTGTCGQNSPQAGYWTKYTYDANNNLTGVTQNAQSGSPQTRTYAYDGLGRMTSETNPESATTYYTYDTDSTCGTSNGDLVKKIDAAGNVTCYQLDSLHRTTFVSYPAGPNASATAAKLFQYDNEYDGSNGTNIKGRLVAAVACLSPTSCAGGGATIETFGYDARGETNLFCEETPHSGGYYYCVNESYWANGAPDQLSGLFNLPTITYNVDGKGRIYSMAASAGQNPYPLTSTTYNSADQPTQVNLGSGDSDSFTYDQNTNRMTQYSFNIDAQSVVEKLNWNQLGTLASLGITDPFNSTDNQTCTYTHDDLTRIASANCGSVWSQTFSYDAFGNLSKNGTELFQPVYSATTNQMTSIGGSIPSYDADGNVLNDFLHTYTWDANGRPVTIDGIGITYDALGRVVEQNRSGSYTEIAYMPTGAKLALMNGQTLSRAFVPLAGGAAAVYTATAPLDDYRHSDWLGNLRLASQPFQAPPWSETAYAPFGEPYAQAGATDVSFTGMNQDTTSNLFDFPAREYGIQGRWPSPDPAGMASVNPADPQTWDRYAYVRNSPLTMTDPTGMDGEDPGGGTECDPDFGCIDCGIYLCGGAPPVDGPELPPLVAVISSSGPVPTTGLPSILANGPGVDYSWLGLLTWAGILSPACTSMYGINPCVQDANGPFDPPGVCTTQDGGVNPESSESRCAAKGGTFQPLSLFQRLTTYITQYVPCVGAEWIANTVGDSEHAEGFGYANLAPLVGVRFGFVGFGVGTGVAAAYDFQTAANIDSTCTAQVYGTQ